jgi:hypothetical protein
MRKLFDSRDAPETRGQAPATGPACLRQALCRTGKKYLITHASRPEIRISHSF